MSAVTSTTVKNLILDEGVVYKNYGLAGEAIIGATAGGNSFTVEREIKEIEVDGVKGKVKGLRRLITENAMLTVNLKEMSTDNIKLALAGSTSTAPTVNTIVPAEYLGLGTSGAETFTFNHAPILGTEVFYVDGVKANWVRGTHYTISGTDLTIIGTNTIALSAELTTGYTWNSGEAATHDVITSNGTIADADYIDNVACVATVSGSTDPVIIILKNVLSDGNFELSLEDKEEAVIELQLSAHYDPASLSTPIYEIRYPKIS